MFTTAKNTEASKQVMKRIDLIIKVDNPSNAADIFFLKEFSLNLAQGFCASAEALGLNAEFFEHGEVKV